VEYVSHRSAALEGHLTSKGYLEYIENVDSNSRIYFIIGRDDLYKVQTKNTDLDIFIKLILRSYTGVFTDYVNIDEQMLSRRAGLTPDEVYQKLKKLSQMKIIHYVPQRKLPVIVYEMERINGNRIKISPENYQDRKLHYQLQVDSVIKYAVRKDECRIVNLLKYFDQFDPEPCGNCDVCKGDHETGISNADFNRISAKIKVLLLTESHAIDQIVIHINEYEKTAVSVARWLLDNGIIISDSKGLLSLKSNKSLSK